MHQARCWYQLQTTCSTLSLISEILVTYLSQWDFPVVQCSAHRLCWVGACTNTNSENESCWCRLLSITLNKTQTYFLLVLSCSQSFLDFFCSSVASTLEQLATAQALCSSFPRLDIYYPATTPIGILALSSNLNLSKLWRGGEGCLTCRVLSLTKNKSK